MSENAKLLTSYCREPNSDTARRWPIAVDLDGTLINSDTLHENLILLAKLQPWSLPAAVKALSRGKAAFKREVATAQPLDAAMLPYNTCLLRFLRAERQAGAPYRPIHGSRSVHRRCRRRASRSVRYC